MAGQVSFTGLFKCDKIQVHQVYDNASYLIYLQVTGRVKQTERQEYCHVLVYRTFCDNFSKSMTNFNLQLTSILE